MTPKILSKSAHGSPSNEFLAYKMNFSKYYPGQAFWVKKTFPSIKPKSDSVDDIRPSIQSIISFWNKTVKNHKYCCSEFFYYTILPGRQERKKGKNGSCKYFKFFKNGFTVVKNREVLQRWFPITGVLCCHPIIGLEVLLESW